VARCFRSASPGTGKYWLDRYRSLPGLLEPACAGVLLLGVVSEELLCGGVLRIDELDAQLVEGDFEGPIESGSDHDGADDGVPVRAENPVQGCEQQSCVPAARP
jgi:hypothetical protein